MTAVHARGLRKRFGETVALAGVDLMVEAGEVRGLLGPNGAGKTTLLRVLLGLVAPDGGALELSESVAGFVESPCFYPYLSGRANLEVLAGFDRDDTAAAIDAALQRVGLAPRSGERVSGYSTGMRLRLGIAAALIRNPRLLLLDEPTSGLDPGGARDLATLIQWLAGDGVAIVLSSHQIGEVEAICDSFTVLNHGRAVWDGTAAQLRDQAPASEFILQTADDDRALLISEHHPQIGVVSIPDGELRVTGSQTAVDAFVLDLGRSGVAVRRLDVLVTPLEATFFALTADSTR